MDELFKIPEMKSPRLIWMDKHGITLRHKPDQDGEMLWYAIHKGQDIASNKEPEWACFYAARKLGIQTWQEEKS